MKPQIVSVLIVLMMLALTPLTGQAQVYRVVDEEGNVTYTDQPPGDGSGPMVLPELSIIETETPPESTGDSPLNENEPGVKTLSELRNMYRDFRIIQPLAEETFWGTANEVTVSWGGMTPLRDGMVVMLYVDGAAQDVTGSASTDLTLERGAHTVYIDLLNGEKKVRTTPKVTFFVKQASIGHNTSPTRSVRTRALPGPA